MHTDHARFDVQLVPRPAGELTFGRGPTMASCVVERRRRRSRLPVAARGRPRPGRRGPGARCRGRRACRRTGSRRARPAASFSSIISATGTRGSRVLGHGHVTERAQRRLLRSAVKNAQLAVELQPRVDHLGGGRRPRCRRRRTRRSRGSGRSSAGWCPAAGGAARTGRGGSLAGAQVRQVVGPATGRGTALSPPGAAGPPARPCRRPGSSARAPRSADPSAGCRRPAPASRFAGHPAGVEVLAEQAVGGVDERR